MLVLSDHYVKGYGCFCLPAFCHPRLEGVIMCDKSLEFLPFFAYMIISVIFSLNIINHRVSPLFCLYDHFFVIFPLHILVFIWASHFVLLSATDVVSIPKTNESFRLLYDTKGRFRLHSLRDDEAKFKLCKVRSIQFGQKGIPYLNTYDGRTIRYPDPLIKANDTIKLDLESNKIVDFIKFDVGNVVMVTGGRNRGRVGVIKNREKHKGSFETIHVQDATGHEFATRLANVFTIGKGSKPWISLPKGKGIKLSIIEEARKRQAASQTAA
uniref:KOW domain-containing protein n=1 Tax=Populus davidiana TaxID=266767 RepID=A0A6M2E956_9ROSI